MSEKEALNAYQKLPLSFVPNEGLTDEAVRYYAQGAGYGFFFTHRGGYAFLCRQRGRWPRAGPRLPGGQPRRDARSPRAAFGQGQLPSRGRPANGHQGLPTHAELLYGGLWPGIDMAVRGEGGNLKYEFHLKPGSSVEDVRLAYRGAEGLSVGAGGELLVQTSLGVLKDAAPVSYQRIGGERVPVKSRYTLTGDGGYGFAVGAYDPRYPLVIDPGLDYSTFLGGTSDMGLGIAVRGAAVPTSRGSPSPLTTPPPQEPSIPPSTAPASDAFVTKLNASGSALDYSTFLGGASLDDGNDIAVDGNGSAYVTGTTSSADYPTTPGAFDTILDGGKTPSLPSSTPRARRWPTPPSLGGRILIGAWASRWMKQQCLRDGDAPTPPTTPPPQAPSTPPSGSGPDAFVTKLNASGSALAYSTFLGGDNVDEGRTSRWTEAAGPT